MYNPHTAAADKLIADNDARIQAEVDAEIKEEREHDMMEEQAERDARRRERLLANDDWILDYNSRG